MTFFADLKVALTPPGAGHAVAQIAATPGASVDAMENAAGGHDGESHSRGEAGRGDADHGIAASPGGRAGEPGAPVSGYQQPVLVYQRYGRGLSVALPIQDSWSWQMDPNGEGRRSDLRALLASDAAVAHDRTCRIASSCRCRRIR